MDAISWIIIGGLIIFLIPGVITDSPNDDDELDK